MEDILMYEAMKGKENCSWKAIAWVIGIVIAVAIFAFIWQKGEDRTIRANERLTDFAVSTVKGIGVLEGNQVTLGEIARNNTSDIKTLLQTASSNRTEVDSIGQTVGQLAFVSARPYPQPHGAPNPAGVVNADGGIPRFRRTTEYRECGSRLFENAVCGNAGA